MARPVKTVWVVIDVLEITWLIRASPVIIREPIVWIARLAREALTPIRTRALIVLLVRLGRVLEWVNHHVSNETLKMVY
jgi:hypothetical protein